MTAVCSSTLIRVTVLFLSIEPMKFCMHGQDYVKNKAEGDVLFQLVQEQRTVRVSSNRLPLDGTPSKTRHCHLEQRLA